MGKTFKDQEKYDRKKKVCKRCGQEANKFYFVDKNQMVCYECYQLIELQREGYGHGV